MSWRTLLVLLLLVLGAGWALYHNVQRDEERAARTDLPLFPGFEFDRIEAVRAENVRRGWTLVLKRREGRWQVVDPVELPAQEALVRHLLQSALGARAREVSDSERDTVAAGFRPPSLVLELEADGRRERIELGEEDPTRGSSFVSVRGVYARVGRELSTALDRSLEEFKTQAVLDFQPGLVRSIERTGQARLEASSADIDARLSVRQEEGEWQMFEPVRATPDLPALSIWLQGLAGIRHEGYVDELGRAPADFGLDPPLMSLRLELSSGEPLQLRLGAVGPRGGENWFAMLESLGVIWALEPKDAYLLSLPVDTFLDQRVLRARREEVDAIRLQGSQQALWIRREGKQWKVAQRRHGEKGFDEAYLADAARVEDLLGELERLELESFRLNQALSESETAPHVYVSVGGETQGGFLGERLSSPAGTDCVLFQRRGELVTGFAPASLIAVLERGADHYWSKRLLEIPEHAQVALSLESGGQRARFVRSSRGLWTRDGEQAQARELLPLLDALCFVRAAEHLAPRVDVEWQQRLAVVFEEPGGKRNLYALGRADDGSIEVLVGTRRARLADQNLFDKLIALLR